jgi:hypothetical protein
MFYAKDWFRFKVVRNPYARVISGFIHIMNTPRLRTLSIPVQKQLDITFEEFVTLLEGLSQDELQSYGQGHCSHQSQPFEREFYHKRDNSIIVYHEVVQVENPQETLGRINEITGSNFSLHTIHRVGTTKTNSVRSYVGDIPWNELKKKGIPKDYGCFYSKDIQARIKKLFHYDLILYNYTFPYQFVDIKSYNPLSTF